MDGSSSVSSDSYLKATSDRFPLPSAWPRGYNYRLSFLWLSKNVDFQLRITSYGNKSSLAIGIGFDKSQGLTSRAFLSTIKRSIGTN